jgi:hypothetical protein
LKNEIKILCQGIKCGKCKRLIARVTEAVKISNPESNIEIIYSTGEILKYATWVLPTLVINEKVIARGYSPSVMMIIKHLIFV